MKKIFLLFFEIFLFCFVKNNNNFNDNINNIDVNDFINKEIFISLNNNNNNNFDINKIINNKIQIKNFMSKFSLNNNNNNNKNFISFFINNYYYKNLICLDKNDLNFYTLKNIIFRHVSTYNYINSDSYTTIENENNFCIERIEFIDINLNLKEKNSLLNENFFYNLINNNNNNNIIHPLIEKLTNINLQKIHKNIINIYNNFSVYKKDSSYEIVLFYNNSINKFLLNKIYLYYFNNNDNNNNNILLKNIFNKIYINSFNYSISNDNNINNNIFIKTNKKNSIFHNSMEINFNNNNNNKKNYNKKYKNCYLIHYILTEDVYIEKNEFKNLIEEYLNNNNLINFKYNLIASRFIEQELSSDLSQQSFFNFYFCFNNNNNNNTIKFPIHFRYQPALNENSKNTHQKVFMPHPLIYKFNKINNINDINKKFFEIYQKNSNNFEEEIDIKFNTILNEFKIFKNNYENLIHFIPAGQMKYFWVIAIVTVVISVCGFLIIFVGIIKNIFNFDEKKKVN